MSRFFIRRPVTSILLAIGLAMAGLFAVGLLPVASLPEVDYPTISVSAQLPGASPQTMADTVATPLIKQFQTIPAVDAITASSSTGRTQIVLQFNLNRSIDAAAADVQSAIAGVQRRLPDNVSPPTYRKVNPADAPILLIAVHSSTMSITDVDNLAENVIAPSLSTIDGVAEAQVFGSQTYAVRVDVDPQKLAARGLSLGQVSSAIAAANSQSPLGTFQTADQSFIINAPTQVTNAVGFASLIIGTSNGNPVRLGDVANVYDSVQNLQTGSWFDGKRAIAIAVMRQPGANTVGVIDAIKARLPALKAAMPTSVSLDITNDASTTILQAVHDVEGTLAVVVGLVVLVIYLFLNRPLATAIPGLAVPLSLLAAFGGMYLLGFSIDNMSLLALTLAVGLVVDDAIVVFENIIRHVEAGERPFEAAIAGSREVAWTVVSMSLSLIAIFIPILLMGGVVGRLFNEFGIVVVLAIAASAFVSLTITPMLAARLPRSGTRSKWQAGPLVFRWLRAADRRLRTQRRLVPQPPGADHARLRRHLRRLVRAVREFGHHLLSARGHRAAVGLDAGAAGHLLRRHGQAPAGGRRQGAGLPRRGARHLQRRRLRWWPTQQRPDVRPAQAEGPAGAAGPGAGAVAPVPVLGSRPAKLHRAGPEPAFRRPRLARAVPAIGSVSRPDQGGRVVAEAGNRDAGPAGRVYRCQHRRRGQRAAGAAHHRPRPGERARRLRQRHPVDA